jgi:RNA polymerase sigma-70 factor (sigma-E family)
MNFSARTGLADAWIGGSGFRVRKPVTHPTGVSHLEVVVTDEASFEEYAQARLPALTRLAYLLTGDHHRAEDVVQTALAQCFARWTRIRSPEAYLRQAVVNAEHSWWRARSASEVPHGVLPDRISDTDLAAQIVGRDAVMRALGRLPRQQRAVVVLFYFEDLTEGAVAEALRISVGAVKRHRTRALARLRQDPELGLNPVEVP